MSTPEDSIASSKSLERPSPAVFTEFPYATLGQGQALHPAVEVRVALASGSAFPFRMLPDSGASHSVFPKSFAAPLGIDINLCKTQKVDTGNGIAYQHQSLAPLKAHIAGHEVDLFPCFGKIKVPVLGRSDFFSYFHVEIDERRRVVTITPHDER